MADEGLAPHVKYSLAKYVDKGEDAWVQQPALECTAGASAPLKVGVFGVFDGHGGKQAAVYSSRHLHTNLQAALATAFSAPAADRASNTAGSDGDGSPKASAEEAEVPRSALAELGVAADALAACDAVDAVAAAMPRALAAAFAATEAAFVSHSQESGTTATMAALVDWEVLVANVGDSLAFLDTGSEVVQVSGNHRLDDSKAERERVLAAGAEVAQSEVDGKPVGPQRVWPGGLAMGRTIGDASAGAVVTCEPEVRQVTLPHTGGRLLLASDGLWDSVSPKTALHHIRGLPASKAASELVNMCQRGRKPRDDITALVIDVIPPTHPEAKLPPLLPAKASGGRGGGNVLATGQDADPVDIFWPLVGEGSSHWRRDTWERRLAVVRAQRQAAEEAAAAEAARAARAAEAAAAQQAAADAEAASTSDAASEGESDVESYGSAASEAASDDDVEYASELHRQMATLRMDPSELEAVAAEQQQLRQQQRRQQREQDQAAGQQVAVNGGWEDVPVKQRPQDVDAFRELAVPGYGAVRQDRQQQGRGQPGRGGRGRGRDGGPGRGRGRQQGRAQQQQQQRPAQSARAPHGSDIADATAGSPVAAADACAAEAVDGVDDAAAGQAAPDAARAAAAAAAANDDNGSIAQPQAAAAGGRGRGRGRQSAGRSRGRGGRYAEQNGGFPAQGFVPCGVEQLDRGEGRTHGEGRGRGRRGGREMLQGRGRGRGRHAPESQQQQQPQPQQPQHQQSQQPPGVAAEFGGSAQQPHNKAQQQQQLPEALPDGVRSRSISAQQLFDAVRAGGGGGGSATAGHASAAAGSMGREAEPANGFAPHMYRHEHPLPQQHRQQQQQQQQPRRHADMGQLQFGSYTAEAAAPPPPLPQRFQFGTMDFSEPPQPQPQRTTALNNEHAASLPAQQQPQEQQQQRLGPQDAARLAAEKAMLPTIQYMGPDFPQPKAPPQHRRSYDPIAAQRGGRPGRGRAGRGDGRGRCRVGGRGRGGRIASGLEAGEGSYAVAAIHGAQAQSVNHKPP